MFVNIEVGRKFKRKGLVIKRNIKKKKKKFVNVKLIGLNGNSKEHLC